MLTQSELKEHLKYDQETGAFTRIKSISNYVKVGDIAGHVRQDGYVRVSVKGKIYLAHRLAWLYVYGGWPREQIDHINHARADNRIENLREATNHENSKNRPPQNNNTSGVVGVHWYKPTKRWMAYIRVNKVNVNLGYFMDKFEAICARKSAERKYGFHLNHGVLI